MDRSSVLSLLTFGSRVIIAKPRILDIQKETHPYFPPLETSPLPYQPFTFIYGSHSAYLELMEWIWRKHLYYKLYYHVLLWVEQNLISWSWHAMTALINLHLVTESIPKHGLLCPHQLTNHPPTSLFPAFWLWFLILEKANWTDSAPLPNALKCVGGLELLLILSYLL